jgi:hypothetical protein
MAAGVVAADIPGAALVATVDHVGWSSGAVMSEWHPIARLMVVGGVLFAVGGVLFQIAVRYLPWLGKLPGDVTIERGNVTVYAPVLSMIIISVFLTIVVNLAVRALGNRP